jgi:hypothetical protein
VCCHERIQRDEAWVVMKKANGGLACHMWGEGGGGCECRSF